MTLSLASVTPGVLTLDGGYRLTLGGVFPINKPLQVYIGPNGSVNDAPCYGGVAGQGNTLYARTPALAVCYSPAIDPLATALNLLPRNIATGTDDAGDTSGFSLCDWTTGYGNTVAGTTPAGSLTSYTGGSPAAWQGSRSLLVQLGTGGVLDFYGVRTVPIPVQPSTTYTFSVYCRGYNGNSAAGGLYAVDQGSHLLASSAGAQSVPAGAYARLALTFTTRADSTFVELRFIEFTDSQYALVMDGWMLNLGAAAAPFDYQQIYRVFINSPATSEQALWAGQLSVRPPFFSSGVFGLRSVMPPNYATGPRSLDRVPGP